MAKNLPENTPVITPYLLYEDVGAALAWLGSAFGFRETFRMPGPDGKVAHAEMRLGDGVVMMGCPGPHYRNPKHIGHVTHNIHVYVDDVDAHHAQAKAAGATIIAPPEDQFYGDRRYAAEDPEGHHWYFAQHMRDVSEDEMKAHLKR